MCKGPEKFWFARCAGSAGLVRAPSSNSSSLPDVWGPKRGPISVKVPGTLDRHALRSSPLAVPQLGLPSASLPSVLGGGALAAYRCVFFGGGATSSGRKALGLDTVLMHCGTVLMP